MKSPSSTRLKTCDVQSVLGHALYVLSSEEPDESRLMGKRRQSRLKGDKGTESDEDGDDGTTDHVDGAGLDGGSGSSGGRGSTSGLSSSGGSLRCQGSRDG